MGKNVGDYVLPARDKMAMDASIIGMWTYRGYVKQLYTHMEDKLILPPDHYDPSRRRLSKPANASPRQTLARRVQLPARPA